MEAWLRAHGAALEDVAARAGVATEDVRRVGRLLAGGMDDRELVERLRAEAPPPGAPDEEAARRLLVEAPAVAAELRRLLAEPPPGAAPA